MEAVAQTKRISIQYLPYHYDQKGHAVEKSVSGKKNKYLIGVTSGPQWDKQGERITPDCVKSLHDQANSGDILLYADRHGVKYTEDIGILTKSEILEGGDWYCENRLYDQSDYSGTEFRNTQETIAKLWKQILGLPPYKYPRQKGFSIEGFIPDDGILSYKQDPHGTVTNRVINKILLDGVIVCPRPAYASVSQAVYKSLEENPPWVNEKIYNNFMASIQTDEIQNSYYRFHNQYSDKLEEIIEKIMTNPGVRDKKDALSGVFDQYKEAMINLVLQSSAMFEKDKSGLASHAEDIRYLYGTPKNEKIEVLKSMLSLTDGMINQLEKEVIQ